MRKFILLLVSAALCSCVSTVDIDKLSAKEKAYINEVKSSKTAITLPKSVAEEGWSRGVNFISKYSGMKIQNSSDFIVETYDPRVSEIGTVGYRMNKLLDGNKVTITVACLRKPMNMKYTKEVCKTNEQILALYIQKNKLMPQFINKSIYQAPKRKKRKR